MADRPRGTLSMIGRVAAAVCAIASATLAAYSLALVYAGATFEHDSLPGPAVLFMVAAAVGLAALLAGVVAFALWRTSRRAPAAPPERSSGAPPGDDVKV